MFATYSEVHITNAVLSLTTCTAFFYHSLFSPYSMYCIDGLNLRSCHINYIM